MNYCIITFRSVTPAQRAEKLLTRTGFSCLLQRTPRWMETQGCGYSIRVRERDIRDCVRLLRDNNIPFRKVYVQRNNVKPEELIL